MNHTTLELTEVSKDAQKEQMNNIGYNNMNKLFVAEKFEDPTSDSNNGTF